MVLETEAVKPPATEREIESLSVPMPQKVGKGYRFCVTQTVTEERLEAFGKASGDLNPLHFNDTYAKRTRFGKRIAHGMLVASFISKAAAELYSDDASQLVVYLSQSLRFKRPVSIGDIITANIEVTDIDPENPNILTLATSCINQHDKVVIDGEAKIMAEILKEPEPIRV